MARMHTRKKGKSGSKRVYTTESPSWVQFSNSEISEMVVKMKDEGLSSAMIGMKLRDQYGIPGTKVVLGKKIGTVLSETDRKPAVPEDLMNLIKKYKNVTRHTDLNKRDYSNIRSRALIMSKILRLVKYYKRSGYLPKEWNLNKVL